MISHLKIVISMPITAILFTSLVHGQDKRHYTKLKGSYFGINLVATKLSFKATEIILEDDKFSSAVDFDIDYEYAAIIIIFS